MTKTEVLERIDKLSEAISLLTDDFSVVGVEIENFHDHDAPAVHVDRYKGDGKNETALAEFGETHGYSVKRVAFYTTHYDGVLVIAPNGVLIFQLVTPREDVKDD